MPEIEDFQTDARAQDDKPQSDAARQLNSLSPWQWPLAFGPFVLVVASAQFPISNKIPTGLFVGLLMIALVWAVAFKGYLLYLNYQK
jgi:hypothetical protein